MAHQNGTATDPVDLLDKLRLFAQANGWTIHNFGARPAGATAGQALQLSKGAVVGTFLSLSSAGTSNDPGQFIGGYYHDAYAGGSGTENQANGSAKVYANGLTGPYQGYDFYCDDGATTPPYLHVVVETNAGFFAHFGLGKLDSLGVLSTGNYVYGSRWNRDPNYINTMTSSRHCVPFDNQEGLGRLGDGTQIRADGDTISPRHFGAVTAPVFLGGPRASSGTVPGPLAAAASNRTGRSVLAPCLVNLARPSSLFSPAGAPPNMRWVMLDYLEPGQVLTVGTDQWKVYPVIRKNGPVGVPNSDALGYAYLLN